MELLPGYLLHVWNIGLLGKINVVARYGCTLRRIGCRHGDRRQLYGST